MISQALIHDASLTPRQAASRWAESAFPDGPRSIAKWRGLPNNQGRFMLHDGMYWYHILWAREEISIGNDGVTHTGGYLISREA